MGFLWLNVIGALAVVLFSFVFSFLFKKPAPITQ